MQASSDSPDIDGLNDIVQVADLNFDSIDYDDGITGGYSVIEPVPSASRHGTGEPTTSNRLDVRSIGSFEGLYPERTACTFVSAQSFEDQPLSDDDVGTKPTRSMEDIEEEDEKDILSRSGAALYGQPQGSTPHQAGTSSQGNLDDVGQGDTLVKVWVKDPQKFESTNKLGMRTSYMSYMVETESTLPSFPVEHMNVRRRFSEFEALFKILRAGFRGYFIPPLPEKSFLESRFAGDDFFRLRRADLQAFLRAVSAHPVLRESDAFHIFLTAPDELSNTPDWMQFMHMPNPPHTVKNYLAANAGSSSSTSLEEAGSSIGSIGKNTGLPSWVSWVKQSVGLVTPPRELPEDEQQLRLTKEFLQDLHRLLMLACESARVLCTHMQCVCEDMRELGQNFSMLCRYEEMVQSKSGRYTAVGRSSEERAAYLHHASLCGGKQHALWKTVSIKTAASLVTLHDYTLLVPEAISALEERESVLSTVHMLEEDLKTKQAALVAAQSAAIKVAGGFTSREKRISSLSMSLASVEEQLRAAREAYDEIKSRNLSELARLNLERESDFRSMLTSFTSVQAQLMQACADVWANSAKAMANHE